MHKGRCKHFNGMLNTHCDAGVCYLDVTTEPERETGRALRLPCYRVPLFLSPPQIAEFEKRGTCEKYQEPTQDEVDAEEAKFEAAIAEWEIDIAANICPTHKTAITKKQVGSCVYGVPCGCRLYQGTLPKARGKQ